MHAFDRRTDGQNSHRKTASAIPCSTVKMVPLFRPPCTYPTNRVKWEDSVETDLGRARRQSVRRLLVHACVHSLHGSCSWHFLWRWYEALPVKSPPASVCSWSDHVNTQTHTHSVLPVRYVLIHWSVTEHITRHSKCPPHSCQLLTTYTWTHASNSHNTQQSITRNSSRDEIAKQASIEESCLKRRATDGSLKGSL